MKKQSRHDGHHREREREMKQVLENFRSRVFIIMGGEKEESTLSWVLVQTSR